MARFKSRLRAPEHPVTVTLDGEELVAERGEPLAAAFVAAEKLTVARSPKFHRPRGPSCMRGACDGCLARVDDVPNIMTCMTPARDGTVVVSQNRLGPREADFLRMTDWFFPDGMNHHELFAGVPGIQNVMQAFARRVAGLGKLPAESAALRAAARRSADVVVVGGGPAGMAVAAHLARRGRRVELFDDQLTLGGSMQALAREDATAFQGIRDAFAAGRESGVIEARVRTTAAGIYGRDLLVVGPEGAEIVESRTLVLASGAHDGTLAFEGNDLPGVMSARAAGFLLATGVVVGERIAVVVAPGGGPFGESFARAVKDHADVEVVHGAPIAVRGGSEPKSVRVRVGDDERELKARRVLIDAPRAPAYELAAQAGAALAITANDAPHAGFVVTSSRIAEGIFAAGELAGVAFDAAALDADAERLASTITSGDTSAR